MATQPSHRAETKMCMALTKDGLKVYANKDAFLELRDWISWMLKSEPAEHYECHVAMSLESEASLFEGVRPRNVWSLVSEEFSGLIKKRTEESPGFELTFMILEDNELDEMAKYQQEGILPERFE